MIAAILGFLSCCVLLSNIFPVFLVMALPCPSSSLPTGSNSSASSSLASANLSDNPPGYDTLMNSQLPSYDDSIVQKTNLPAQVLRNRMDEKLFLTMLPSSLLSFFVPKSPFCLCFKVGVVSLEQKEKAATASQSSTMEA